MTDPRHVHAPTGFHEDRQLRRSDLDPDPFVQFRLWLDAADRAGIALPNAMALATADAEGRPSLRHVLLRGLDDRGFTFFTNHASRKGRQLEENPHAAICFLWKELDRQVSAAGRVERVDADGSDAYFATRPRGAQIGAWASAQSSPIADREALEALVERFGERFAGGQVPRPPHWGGYRLLPETVEFWQGRRDRLHDRFSYERRGGGWTIERLSP